jgi:antitoxin HicB
MKRRTFQEYLKTRLTSEEIADIKKQALQEKDALKTLQEKKKHNKHLGRDFDDYLKEEGILEKVELAAIKMIITDQITKEMKKKKLSQTEMAKRLGTSEAAVMRLLNPKNYSVTLLTLYRVAAILDKKLEIKFH